MKLINIRDHPLLRSKFCHSGLRETLWYEGEMSALQGLRSLKVYCQLLTEKVESLGR